MVTAVRPQLLLPNYPEGNDAFTTALLHLNGANGGTTFTDVNFGGSAHTWTAAGNAQTKTDASRFGGSSLFCDGTGDVIQTGDSADFDFGGGEFTVDAWINLNALPTGTNAAGLSGTIASQWRASPTSDRGWAFAIQTTGGGNFQLALRYNTAGAGVISVGSVNFSISTGAWHHVAVVRDNTGTDRLRYFYDGAAVGTDTGINGATIQNSAANCMLGGYDTIATNQYNGWIQELRISKGIARWVAAFTPPVRPYG